MKHFLTYPNTNTTTTNDDAAELALDISSNVMRVGRAQNADVPALQLLLQSLDSAALALRLQHSHLTQLSTPAPTSAPPTHEPTSHPTVIVNSTHNSTRNAASSSSGRSGNNLRGRRRLAIVPSGQPTGQPSEQPSGQPTGSPSEVPTSSPTLAPIPPAIQLILPCLSIFIQSVTAVQVPGMLMQNMRYDTFAVSVFVAPTNQRGEY